MSWIAAPALAVAALLVAAPAADGARRYVTPGGSATDTICAPAAPCELRHAIETVAQPNDEVVVAPGTYVTGPIRVDVPLEIHGIEGQARPVVTTADPIFGPLYLVGSTVSAPGAGGSVVRHLRLEFRADPPFAALGTAAAVTLEQLEVVRAGGGTAVQLGYGSLLRDSVVMAAGSGARAVSVDYSGSHDAHALRANLRNVTASAVGSGSVGLVARGYHEAEMMLCQEPQHAVVSLVNSIVRGEADLDLGRAGACPDNQATATVTAGNSNYRGEAVLLGAGAQLVDDGGNQAADPLFVDAQNGNLHLRAGSPAIDAGRQDALNGARDIDGEPRLQGAAFDVGADEMPAAVVPPNGGTGGAGPVSSTPRVDATPPAASRVRLRRRFVDVPACRTSTGGWRPRIDIRFVLSEPAHVRIALIRLRPDGDRIKAGTIRARGRAGNNSVRVRCRRLRPGRYRATLVAVDAAGNGSERSIRFRVRWRRRSH